MADPELDIIVGGKYRLVRQLGEGGMGTVYEAENALTLKRAAVKLLHPQFAAHEEGFRRVVQEARASARVQHENVVDVYDVLREGDAIYLVMELLIGESLSALLARGPLPLCELIALLLPVLRGAAAAHAAGVVHRDIKPDNIFLARVPGYDAPVPKLIDFGISKVFEADEVSLTRSGITMGTPKYVSFEQLLGARDVDARTDVYAFGVILYEAITGRPPYGEGATFGEQAVRFATLAPLSLRALRGEVPEELARLVERAIAKDREQRTPTLERLIEELAPFAHAERAAGLATVCLAKADPVATTVSTPTPTPTPTPQPKQMSTAEVEATSARVSRAARASRRRVVAATVCASVTAAWALTWLTQSASPSAESVNAWLDAGASRSATAPAALAPAEATREAVAAQHAEVFVVAAPDAGVLTESAASTGSSARAAQASTKPMAGHRRAAQPASADDTKGRALARPDPNQTLATSAVLPLSEADAGSARDDHHRAGRVRRQEF